MEEKVIRSERLILRPWKKEDLKPFAALNADPYVMEYFPSIKSFEESRKEYDAILDHFKKYGYGFWAVTEIFKHDFMGFIGLRYIDFPAPFTPAVEIGWRLGYQYWGKGYATEGAQASLKFGFEVLRLKEIISFTATLNLRSQAVMKRIHMHSCPQDDFDHPKLPEYHPLRKHVLYRIKWAEWQAIKNE